MLKLQRRSMPVYRLNDTFKMDRLAVSKVMKKIRGHKPHKQLAIILQTAREEKAKFLKMQAKSPKAKSATLKQARYRRNEALEYLKKNKKVILDSILQEQRFRTPLNSGDNQVSLLRDLHTEMKEHISEELRRMTSQIGKQVRSNSRNIEKLQKLQKS